MYDSRDARGKSLRNKMYDDEVAVERMKKVRGERSSMGKKWSDDT